VRSQLLPSFTRRRIIIGGCIYAALLTFLMMRSFPSAEDYLRVFGSYWAAGDAATRGLNPYLQHPMTWVTQLGVVDLNLNPPTLLPLFQLFAQADPVMAARVFTLTSGLIYIGTILALLTDPDFAPARWQIVWLFACIPFVDTLGLGQIYMLLFALGAAAWLSLRHGRPILAGVFIGLVVAAKPNFGIWPALLLLCGHWRAAISAGLTGLAALLISIGLYGVESYQQWLVAIAADGHAIVITDVSMRGYFSRLGQAELGMVLSATVLISVAGWSWWRQLPPLDTSRIGIATAILVSPLAWPHYTLLLIPAMLDRRASLPIMIAMALLAVPVMIPLLTLNGAPWIRVLGGSIYFSAVCLLLYSFIARIPSSRSQIKPSLV
jgi:hypothetical protein